MKEAAMADKSKGQPKEKRREKRHAFGYYMPLMDENGMEVIGHLSDISPTGFRLDCREPIPGNRLIRFRLNLTPEVSEREFIVFTACSRWSKPDRFDIWTHNVGFEITEIEPDDAAIFQRIVELYGSKDKKSLF
jgi:hypothetical protein